MERNQRIFKQGDKVYIKVNNSQAQYDSKLQSHSSTPHKVIACKGVVVTLRTLSNNAILKVHADRLSNSLIALRHEAAAPANNVPLGDSPIPSSAHDSDSEDSIASNHSNLGSIAKGFHDITKTLFGKRIIKRNEKKD